jgi:hypothetical protein
MKVHNADGWNIQYPYRGAWEVDLWKSDVTRFRTPVSWENDYDKSTGTLLVWFKNTAKLEGYRARTEPFLVPLIVAKSNDARAFANFTHVYSVQATGNIVRGGVETKVLGRG